LMEQDIVEDVQNSLEPQTQAQTIELEERGVDGVAPEPIAADALPAPQVQPRRIPLLRYIRLLTIWRRSCIFFSFYFIPIIIAIVTVLIVERSSSCDKPLKAWLIVLGILHTIMLFLTIRVYVGLPRLDELPESQERRIRSIFKFYAMNRALDFFWFIWFLLGIIWTFTNSCSESAPHLVKLCVALVFIQISLFCLITFCCCCTCCGLLYQIALVAENRAPSGASKKMIQSLKSKTFQANDVQKDDASCAICLSEYEENELIRYLPCKHHFHSICVDEWLQINKSCPLCKHLIDENMQNSAANVSSSVPSSLP